MAWRVESLSAGFLAAPPWGSCRLHGCASVAHTPYPGCSHLASHLLLPSLTPEHQRSARPWIAPALGTPEAPLTMVMVTETLPRQAQQVCDGQETWASPRAASTAWRFGPNVNWGPEVLSAWLMPLCQVCVQQGPGRRKQQVPGCGGIGWAAKPRPGLAGSWALWQALPVHCLMKSPCYVWLTHSRSRVHRAGSPVTQVRCSPLAPFLGLRTSP